MHFKFKHMCSPIISTLLIVFVSSLQCVWGSTGLKSDLTSLDDSQKLHLTLNRAMEIAHHRNLIKLAADESVITGRARLTQANSAILPQIELNASYTRLHEQPVMDFNGMTIVMGQQDNYDATISGSQVLFSGGAISNSIAQAKHALSAAQHDAARISETVTFMTIALFNGVLLAREEMNVANLAVEMADTNFKEVALKHRQGMVRKFDLIRAEELVSRNRAFLEAARNAHENARVQLATFLRLDTDKYWVADGELSVLSWNIDCDNALEIAKENRRDRQKMNALLHAQKAGISVARSGFLPTIAAFGEYSQSNPDSTYADDWEESWLAGIQLNVSIFDGGTTWGRVREARSEYRKIELMVQQIDDQIREEVTISINNLNTAEIVLRSRNMNTKQAEEALRLARISYREGLIQQLDVLNAQLAFTQSRQEYAHAMYDHTLAIAQVKYAMGTLHQMDAQHSSNSHSLPHHSEN